MNILFITNRYPGYGGIERVTTVLANHFVKKSNQIVIVSFEQEYAETIADINPSIRLLNLNEPYCSKENIRTLRQIIVSNRIDIIINQRGDEKDITSLCYQAKRNTPCKLISVLHFNPHWMIISNKNRFQLNEGNRFKNLIKRSLGAYYFKYFELKEGCILKSNYKKSDQFILLSKRFEEELKQLTKLKNTDQLHNISNPLTIEALPVKQKEKSMLYVGRIENVQKRVDRAVSIWENISKLHADWKFQVIGDGSDKEKLENYALKQKIANISFKGYHPKPEIFYQTSSIIILTSDFEGFGLVITEAMSMGVVPVIYGSYSAAFDLIENGVNGYIIQPFNQTDFENTLNSLMNDPVHLATLSKNAQKAAQRYSLDHVCEQWNDVFNRIQSKIN